MTTSISSKAQKIMDEQTDKLSYIKTLVLQKKKKEIMQKIPKIPT